jgi:hypothetical protein
MVKVLALDLSIKSCGWALWGDGFNCPRHGVWELADGIEYADRAFVRLSKNIMDLHKLETLTHTAFEEPLPPGKLATGTSTVATIEAQVGLAAQVMRFGAARGVNWSKAPIDRWRKHFIGRTRNPKDVRDGRGRKIWQPTLKDYAMQRCRELEWEPRKHDEADALGILDYTLWRLGIDRPWAYRPSLLLGRVI